MNLRAGEGLGMDAAGLLELQGGFLRHRETGAAAEQALKGSNGSTVLIGTHGSTGVAGAKLVTSYDPGAQTNDPQFPTKVVIENPANAAAAKADAQRYAQLENAAESGAVIGTHGSVGVKAVTYFDPAAHTNDPQFSALPILVK